MNQTKDYGYGEWQTICPQCEKTRTVRCYKYKTGGVRLSKRNSSVCLTCSNKNREGRRVDLVCPGCGETRNLKPCDALERITNLCKICVRKTGARRIRGNRHTVLTSRGYVMVLGVKNHPLANNAGQVSEHWMTVYEQHPMGPESVLWFKSQGFTIHHKNGVRDDNQLHNLELKAPGRHGPGWSIEDMREVIRRYDSSY